MTAGKIAFYHSMFTVCLAAALLCLATAAVLFFVLDIREAILYLSGGRRRRGIREMQHHMGTLSDGRKDAEKRRMDKKMDK